MPSLHAAAPVLIWLTDWKVWPRWGWALGLYPLAMAFSVVYLGEHYAVDVLVGALYAAAAYAIVWGDWRWAGRRLATRCHCRPRGEPLPEGAALVALLPMPRLCTARLNTRRATRRPVRAGGDRCSPRPGT